MKKRKLPIGGVQTFRDVRRDYDVYVDKTMHIYNLATSYKTVFLARPRRFGKSLLCSTIDSLFRCEKELFEGLAISGTDWEWKEHPVIHLEFGAENFTRDGVKRLISSIDRQLDVACSSYEVSIPDSGSISDKFARVIIELSKKVSTVVVIVDEYDNPLLNTLNLPELNEELRNELKGFYSVLKQCDQYLRFTFVTGVTKFSQISMFSGFNQPKDISMMPDYCDICGITQEELEECFAPEIEAFAPRHGGREKYLERLKSYYDGYNFTRVRKPVYNTYGLLNHLDESGEFAPYWSRSGEPSFARKYLEAKEVDIVDIESEEMVAGDFGDYRDDTITIFPLLYQAGYLTIADYDDTTGLYRLCYPNTEVRQSLAEFLSKSYSNADIRIGRSTSAKLVKSLLDGRPEVFMDLLKQYMSKVDYSLSSKITEHYFEFAASNIINMLGLECRNEVHTATGRMDAVIFAGAYIYVFEFKVDKPVGAALRQLEKKDYAALFAGSGKKVMEIGVVFSREERNIVGWEVLGE